MGDDGTAIFYAVSLMSAFLGMLSYGPVLDNDTKDQEAAKADKETVEGGADGGREEAAGNAHDSVEVDATVSEASTEPKTGV
jgi:hypothetical protein